MKINQKVKTKHRNRYGKIISIEHVEGLSTEYVVRLESGDEMIFYGAELEVVDV
jgi:precorrin-4 methylase